MFVATKKQLLNRWLEEPGHSIAARIRSILIDYAELLGPLQWKAHEQTGLYLIPKEWLPPFDTKEIFDLLEGLPRRSSQRAGPPRSGFVRWMPGMGPEEYRFFFSAEDRGAHVRRMSSGWFSIRREQW